MKYVIATMISFCCLLILSSIGRASEDLEAEIARSIKKDSLNPLPVPRPSPDGQAPTTQGARPLFGNQTNPAISIILDFAGAAFSESNRFHQGGHAPHKNGPFIQGAELAATSHIDPYFTVDLAFGMAHLHLEEVYLTTMNLPLNLQIRAGQFKSKIGRHNPTHLHSWNFVTQPIANEFLFGAEGIALPGMELSWLIPLPWYVEFIGALQMGSAASFRTKSIGEGDATFTDFLYPLRLVQFFDISDNIALQLGVNTVVGPSDLAPEAGNRTFAYGFDFTFKWRPIGLGRSGTSFLSFTSEIWLRQMEVPEDTWNDIGEYSQFLWGISKRWSLAFRQELWRSIQGKNKNVPQRYGVDTFKISTALNFAPSHFSRIRLQHEIALMDSFNETQAIFLQFEVSAGAHKAHDF